MWEKIFRYDLSCPSGLWYIRYSRPSGHLETNKKSGIQYWRVGYLGKLYLAHRVIWNIFNGEIPDGMIIDHIDKNSLNNNINNLRLISQADNNRNASLRKDNSTGVAGVQYMTSPDGYEYYRAVWSEGLTKKSKLFSIRKLGKALAFELCKKYRKEMIESLIETGKLYSPLHGKERK